MCIDSLHNIKIAESNDLVNIDSQFCYKSESFRGHDVFTDVEI